MCRNWKLVSFNNIAFNEILLLEDCNNPMGFTFDTTTSFYGYCLINVEFTKKYIFVKYPFTCFSYVDPSFQVMEINETTMIGKTTRYGVEKGLDVIFKIL